MTTTRAHARRRPGGNLPGWRQAMRDGLTPTQRAILLLIVEHLRRFGRPPTYRWLMQERGIRGPNGMKCHLTALQSKGLIVCDFSRSAGIRLAGCTLRLECDGSPAGLRLRRLLGEDNFEQGGGI